MRKYHTFTVLYISIRFFASFVKIYKFDEVFTRFVMIQVGKTLTERKWRAAIDRQGRVDISKVLMRIQGGVLIYYSSFPSILHHYLESVYLPGQSQICMLYLWNFLKNLLWRALLGVRYVCHCFSN